MSLLKITGQDSMPVLLFLIGLLLAPVFYGLTYFAAAFLYPMFASLVAATLGVVWLIIRRRRHDEV
jgi:hypothetical protein